MSTLIRPSEFTAHQQRSDLPPGGSPADDAAYLDWARNVTDAAVRAWMDSRSGWGRELPRVGRNPVNMWQLSTHLFKWLIGWNFPSGEGPTNNHRVRMLAVQLKYRRLEMELEAARYLAEKIDEAEQAQG
jgi:hypothetical protein